MTAIKKSDTLPDVENGVRTGLGLLASTYIRIGWIRLLPLEPEPLRPDFQLHQMSDESVQFQIARQDSLRPGQHSYIGWTAVAFYSATESCSPSFSHMQSSLARYVDLTRAVLLSDPKIDTFSEISSELDTACV